jgi:RNA polymerase sigma factor (sigma-70 family)
MIRRWAAASDPAVDESTALLVAARVDPSALGELFRREFGPLVDLLTHIVLCPEIAADLAAESFAVVVRDLHRFDPRRGTAAQWLRGIARNQARSWMRRGLVDNRARQRLGILTPPLTETDVNMLHNRIDDEPLRLAVRHALSELSDQDREVIKLRVVDELDYERIANQIGCTVNAARVRTSRALARLRSRLDDVAPLTSEGRL